MRNVVFVVVFVLVAVVGFAQDGRDVNGSTVVFDSYVNISATDLQLNFTATGVSSSLEYLDRVTIDLPPSWTITSLTSTDFDATGGVGTNVATFSDSGYPCSGFGKSCSSGCVLVVHVDPNGVYSSQTLPWMIEGDSYGGTPDSVVCSPGHDCNHDACYDALGSAVESEDMVTGPVPVELQTFSVE